MSNQENNLSRTLSRINREWEDISRSPSSDWWAAPVNIEEPYEWHFTLRGPDSTDFKGGLYHGRFVLPFKYPFAPPAIFILTPNGRFELNKKVCLSISSFHPELWQPAWGIRTMLEALRGFLETPAEGAVGSLEWPSETRRALAIESKHWRCSVCQKTNSELLKSTEQDLTAEPLEVHNFISKTESTQNIEEESLCHPTPTEEASPETTAVKPIQGRSVIWELLDLFGPARGTFVMTLIVDIHLVVVFSVIGILLSDIILNPPK